MVRTPCLPTDGSASPIAPQPATAIILAGGMSIRMGCDKAMLPFLGRPMIEHVFLQLRPHFEQILIGANAPEKFAFLNAVVVPDKTPGVGPLMGIASCLEASPHELNFVVACDIPTLDMSFVQHMLHQSGGIKIDTTGDCDCVVPVNDRGQLEPLLAVYKKTALEAMWSTLASGQCRIRRVFSRCRVRYVRLPEESRLDNVNTTQDYEQLLSRQSSIEYPYAV